MEKLVSFLFVVFSVCAFGQTPKELFEVYPGPKGIAPSKKYQVSVSQNNLEKPSFVYYSTPLDNDEDNAEKVRHEVIGGINANEKLKDFYFEGQTKDLNAEQSCSYSCFSFYGKIAVKVKSQEIIKSFKILPSSKNIQVVIEGNQLSFNLDKPEKLALVINNDYLNPLFLFADAPEQAIPDKNRIGTLVVKPGDDMVKVKGKVKKASVVYFEPGIHNIGVAFEVYANQTIYLAGGAYLLGTIHGEMTQNVTIRGRGVLAGDKLSRQYVRNLKNDKKKNNYERLHYHAINMLSHQNKTSWNAYANFPGEGCDNLTIEGITIASPRQFFIRATGVPITIQNVKMVGSWPYNTDGVSTIGQANTTVFDCFFHCNDDAIYVSPNNANIHHCTFWQGNNGNVFQFEWGGAPYNQGGAYIHDCDVVHTGHVSEANNRMIIGSRKSGPGDIGHVYFKNINIEGPVWSLFRLQTNGKGNLGSIHDITLENISVNGPVIHKSNIISSIGRVEGEHSDSWIKDITFKNVMINGKKMTKNDIEIGDFQVKNITVE